jgi:hypothetical protein
MVDNMSNSVMKQVIDHFSESPLSQWRIDHKKLWLEYLETGKLPFTSNELHTAIQKISNQPENRPRGEKLLSLHKKNNFTLKKDKTPYRPEEALERFIVVSNEDNFFNQVPVGGGKESIDIVIRNSNDSVEFIELKPWNSGDSPLYALIEELKNLIEYRVIVEKQIKAIDTPWKVDISLLAPKEYYQKFFLIDKSNNTIAQNISQTTDLVNDLSLEFNINITIFSLALTNDSFKQACSRIYDHQGLTGQQIASVNEDDAISTLHRANWAELASSRKI